MRYPTIIYDEEDDVPSYQDLSKAQPSAAPAPKAVKVVEAPAPKPEPPPASKPQGKPSRGGWSPAISTQADDEQSEVAPAPPAADPAPTPRTRPASVSAPSRGWSPALNWKPGEEEGYGEGIEVGKPIASSASKSAHAEVDARFASAEEVVRLASTVENLASTVRALRPAIVLDLELPDITPTGTQAVQPPAVAEEGSVALESLAFTVKSLASTVQSLASTVGHLTPEKTGETVPHTVTQPAAVPQEPELIARSTDVIELDIPASGSDDDVVEEIVESDLNITVDEAAAGLEAVQASPADEPASVPTAANATESETSIADEITPASELDDGVRQDDTPPAALTEAKPNDIEDLEIDDGPVQLTESVKPPPPVVTDEPLQITVPEISKLSNPTTGAVAEPEPETAPPAPRQDELAEFDAAVQNPEVSAALAELEATQEEAAAETAVDEPPAEVTSSSTPPDLPALNDQLVQACLSGQLKLVSMLLDAGADPNAPGVVTTEEGETYEGITPIQAAILAAMSEEVTPKMLRKQTARIVKVLLSRGALTTENERDLVMHCANHDLGEVIEVLGEHNVRLRRYAFDTIGIALHHGHLDVLRAMGKSGCSVNIMNDRGNRPFLDLCSRTMRSPILNKSTSPKTVEDMTERIRQFIECGLNLEATDKVGATALIRSIATGNEAMSWALIAAGANPKARLRNGVSVAHLAASSMGAGFLRRFLVHTDTYSDLARLKALRLQPDVRALVAASVQHAQQAKAERIA